MVARIIVISNGLVPGHRRADIADHVLLALKSFSTRTKQKRASRKKTDRRWGGRYLRRFILLLDPLIPVLICKLMNFMDGVCVCLSFCLSVLGKPYSSVVDLMLQSRAYATIMGDDNSIP